MRVSDLQQVISSLLGQIEKSETVELTPGKIITAFLKEIRGNTAFLNYKGKDFSASLETEIPAGQQLKFLVAGEKDGQTVLKLLTPNRDNNGTLLKNIIKGLGLTDEQVNLKLVGEMIKHEMPLTPAAASKLSTFVRNFNIPEQNIWLPLFMYNKGIPLTQQNYQENYRLLTDMQYLQDDLTELYCGLQKLAASADTTSESGKLAVSISKVLAQFNLNAVDGTDNMASKLEAVFRMENAQLTQPAQPANTFNEIINRLIDLVEKSEDKPGKIALQQFGARLHAVLHEILNQTEQTQDLITMLQKLSVSLNENNNAGNKELVRLMQNVSERIDFIRNFNSYVETGGRENMMVVYSSIVFEEAKEPLRLAVKYRMDNKENRRDFSKCRVDVRLNTPGLGAVKCEIQMAEKNLTVQFAVDNEPAVMVLDRFAGILSARLQGMKYNVTMLPSRIAPIPENDFLPDGRQNIPGLFQLNLKI